MAIQPTYPLHISTGRARDILGYEATQSVTDHIHRGRLNATYLKHEDRYIVHLDEKFEELALRQKYQYAHEDVWEKLTTPIT